MKHTNIIKTFKAKKINDLEREANKYGILNCLSPISTSLIQADEELILVVLYENKFNASC